MLRRLILLACSAPFLFAQGDALRTMMKDSADAWNRGDLPAFAAYYENSPETTFMGKEVIRGGNSGTLPKGAQHPRGHGDAYVSEIEVRPLAGCV